MEPGRLEHGAPQNPSRPPQDLTKITPKRPPAPPNTSILMDLTPQLGGLWPPSSRPSFQPETFLIIYGTSYIIYIYHIWCITFDVSHMMLHIWCITFYTSHMKYHPWESDMIHQIWDYIYISCMIGHWWSIVYVTSSMIYQLWPIICDTSCRFGNLSRCDVETLRCCFCDVGDMRCCHATHTTRLEK